MGVRATGFRIWELGKAENRPKNSCLLIWCTEGCGKFWINKKAYVVEKDYVAIYTSADFHRYQSVSDSWQFCWFSTDGPLADQIIFAFNLKKQPTKVGPCPDHLFNQLLEALRDNHPQAERLASSIAYHILAYVAGYQARKNAPRLWGIRSSKLSTAVSMTPTLAWNNSPMK